MSLDKAANAISNRIGEVVKYSGVYESAPWGFVDDTSFLNQVLLVESELEAKEILGIILELENELGRVRMEGNAYVSRKIDIDILYFGEQIFQEEVLQVPHPRLHLRRFTLVPLAEIAPSYVHPKLNKSNKELLDGCEDHSIVNKFKTGIN